MKTKTKRETRSNAGIAITPGQLMLALCGLFLLNLLLRGFYIRYDFVNGDEGVRALTAVRMLEGARLYADVVTDKPPGASLFYAAVFTVFGSNMKAVHLAATLWNFGSALVICLIGTRFYGRRIGLWAALLFVYFSTNYFTQDMIAANTELLMALPYSAAFYFFMTAASEKSEPGKTSPFNSTGLIAAGLLTGLATLFSVLCAVRNPRDLECAGPTSRGRRPVDGFHSADCRSSLVDRSWIHLRACGVHSVAQVDGSAP